MDIILFFVICRLDEENKPVEWVTIQKKWNEGIIRNSPTYNKFVIEHNNNIELERMKHNYDISGYCGFKSTTFMFKFQDQEKLDEFIEKNSIMKWMKKENLKLIQK